jgi:DNA-binding transcriptional MerR regulator
MTTYLVGEMARLAGVTPETVRYYENRGLLASPERDASGYRRYSEEALEQLKLIKAAQAFGFTLDEIGKILAQFRDGPAPCPPVREIVQQRIDSIDALVASLSRMRDRLSVAINSCGDGPCELDAQFLAAGAEGSLVMDRGASRVGTTGASHAYAALGPLAEDEDG